MRRRARRDLAVIVGIIGVLAVAFLVNNFSGRSRLISEFTAMRTKVENARQKLGWELLGWAMIRETQGNRFTGPTFSDDLLAMDGQQVNLIGFMVPIDRYLKMTEFLVLPLPIECYFCEMPPMRDVMLVQMAEGQTSNLYKEPMLISGVLHLNRGDKSKFFYSMREATVSPGDQATEPTPKVPDIEHMAPAHIQSDSLSEGYEPPKAQ